MIKFQGFFHIFTPSPRKMTSKMAQNGKNQILMKWVAENVQGGTVLTIYIRYQYEVRYDLCGVKVRQRTPKPKVVSSIPGWVNIFIITFFLFLICNTYQPNLPLKRWWKEFKPCWRQSKSQEKDNRFDFFTKCRFSSFLTK